MLTVVVYAVLAIVVVSALVAIAVLVLPGTEQLAPAPPDRTPWALPAERAMTGPDVGRLRLPVTLRGYRFAETDAVLDRLGEEIAYRDSVIATLQAELEDRETPAAERFDDPLDGPLDESLDDLGDGPLVEMGETPEETEHEDEGETDRAPLPQGDIEVETVEVVEVEVVEVVAGPPAAEPPAVEPPLVERPAVERSMVALDDEQLDLELPDGPAPRP